MRDKHWDIFMKTGGIGAYLQYRNGCAYDDYYNYEMFPDVGENPHDVLPREV